MGKVVGITDRKNIREWDKIRADLDGPDKPTDRDAKQNNSKR